MTWDFHKQFINGEWVPSTGEGRIKVVNPATLEAFEWVPDGTYEDADRAVCRSARGSARLGRNAARPTRRAHEGDARAPARDGRRHRGA